MKNTAIIIPSRLAAERFPNKPLEKINNLPMIVHAINRAKESQVGEVFVATPDDKIFDIVKENGGQPIMTKNDHLSGSDRIYEAYLNKLNENIDLIINLQGDMPNIKPNSISKLEKLMKKNDCDILPIYFHGKNSFLFHIVSKISFKLRKILFFSEAIKLSNKIIYLNQMT